MGVVRCPPSLIKNGSSRAPAVVYDALRAILDEKFDHVEGLVDLRQGEECT